MRGSGYDRNIAILHRISLETAFQLRRLKVFALRWWFYIGLAVVLLLVVSAGLVFRNASKALTAARNSVRAEQEMAFATRPIPFPISTGFSGGPCACSASALSRRSPVARMSQN